MRLRSKASDADSDSTGAFSASLDEDWGSIRLFSKLLKSGFPVFSCANTTQTNKNSTHWKRLVFILASREIGKKIYQELRASPGRSRHTINASVFSNIFVNTPNKYQVCASCTGLPFKVFNGSLRLTTSGSSIRLNRSDVFRCFRNYRSHGSINKQYRSIFRERRTLFFFHRLPTRSTAG